MSDQDHDENAEQQEEQEEPRTKLKQEQITEGLSLIARTAGKLPLVVYWLFV